MSSGHGWRCCGKGKPENYRTDPVAGHFLSFGQSDGKAAQRALAEPPLQQQPHRHDDQQSEEEAAGRGHGSLIRAQR